MITAKNIYITSKRSLFSGWLLMFLSFTLPAVAQEQPKATKKEIVKSHLKQHFQLYGFVRNYFTFDSRESYSGTGDLYSFMPKDENWNQTADAATTSGVPREDLNAVSTFRFLLPRVLV